MLNRHDDVTMMLWLYFQSIFYLQSSSLFDLGRNNGSYNVTSELTVHHCSTEVLLLYAGVPGDDIRVGQFATSSALRWWFPKKKDSDDFIFCSTTMASKLDSSGFHNRRDRWIVLILLLVRWCFYERF